MITRYSSQVHTNQVPGYNQTQFSVYHQLQFPGYYQVQLAGRDLAVPMWSQDTIPRSWTSNSQVVTRYCSQVITRYKYQLLANQLPAKWSPDTVSRSSTSISQDIPWYSAHVIARYCFQVHSEQFRCDHEIEFPSLRQPIPRTSPGNVPQSWPASSYVITRYSFQVHAKQVPGYNPTQFSGYHQL